MKNIKSLVLNILAAGCLMIPISAFAAEPADIEALEKSLIQKETELLEPELKLDRLFVERGKLDGLGGVFQGSKKKALEKQIAETGEEVKKTYSEMVTLQKQVQEMVFNVASTLEKNGEYRKAIEYYLKIERQDDAVRGRIAGCFKALKEYEQAIQWLLRMARTDANLLEVADCYRLDTRMKDAIYWLFQIVEPLEGNPAELTAITQLESWNYPEKMVDYPNFNQRLSDVYLSKAVLNVQADFTGAKADYTKAVMLLAGNGDPKTTSFGIVTRTQGQYNAAMDMLAQQRDAAERNYENMLREAKSDYDDAEHKYRRAQDDAESEYRRRVDYARRELDRAEADLRAAEQQNPPVPDQVSQARGRVDQCRNEYNRIMSNHSWFIDDYVAPAKREMERAQDKYEDIMRHRTEIVEKYIAPYKAQVEMARRRLEIINNLHQATYGLN
ncbi:MAG TPA: hypothetical protein PKM25_00895 [Candidatus Ozemobacteraceae bacterium]|nr:hypothetical protein [Candidatus Ozemobacteraceae bacterium]